MFRLDDSLSCQTHDLIGCTCGGKGSLDVSTPEIPEIVTRAIEDNDEDFPEISTMIKGSQTNVAEPNIKLEPVEPDVDDEDDELDDSPRRPTLIKASQVNMTKQEATIKQNATEKKNKASSAKMQSLMAYSHVNTSNFSAGQDEDMETLIHDEVLLDVLKDEGNRVSFVFAKTSTGCS